MRDPLLSGRGNAGRGFIYYKGFPADLHKQAAEAHGELLLGNRDGSARDPTPVTLLTGSERLAKLKVELQEKRLYSQEYEGRASQRS
jgi:hypothetical protein